MTRHHMTVRPAWPVIVTQAINRADGTRCFVYVGYESWDFPRPKEVVYGQGLALGSDLEIEVKAACMSLSLHLEQGVSAETIVSWFAEHDRPDDPVSMTRLIAEGLCRPPTASRCPG